MIEYKLLNSESKIAKKSSRDEIRARALSYACVSHGIDPEHLTALRYAMIKDQQTWNTAVPEDNKKIADSLFTEDKDMPMTTRLMRTRILGALVQFEATVKKVEENPKLKVADILHPATTFGRVRSEHKRASMFI